MKKLYISQNKFNELADKIKQVKEVDFANNRRVMRSAIDHGGGTHDNAGYDIAYANERVILTRISELEDILSKVIVVNNNEVDTESVRLGTQVTVFNFESDKEEVFIISGVYGADVNRNQVSYLSPVAKNLLGKAIGDVIEIKLPQRKLTYEIITIEAAADW